MNIPDILVDRRNEDAFVTEAKYVGTDFEDKNLVCNRDEYYESSPSLEDVLYFVSTTGISGKVEKKQSVEDAEKIACVQSDGNIKFVEPAAVDSVVLNPGQIQFDVQGEYFGYVDSDNTFHPLLVGGL